MERERRIREIESDMLDCNEVFKDLAMLVHVQGETIGMFLYFLYTTGFSLYFWKEPIAECLVLSPGLQTALRATLSVPKPIPVKRSISCGLLLTCR